MISNTSSIDRQVALAGRPLSPSITVSPPTTDFTSTGGDDQSDQLREKFTEFVGQTFFGSVLASMRKTVGKPAYMHGGRGEDVFQKQLDAELVSELTKSSADQFADPMFDLFNMQRQ